MASGDFPISIEWYLNGETLLPDSDESVSIGKPGKRLSYLNIDSVDGHHAGIYTCIASNLAGGVEHSARLIVNGIHFGFGDFFKVFYCLLTIIRFVGEFQYL